MLTRARIAVLVSGGGTNLQALLDAQRDGKMPHGEIVLVVSSRAGAYALTRAENAGVAARVLSPACGQKPFENELSVLLREQKIDLILLAGFTVILSAEFTKQWPRRILNVHPSLIPAFCGKGMYGLRVHEAALARREGHGRDGTLCQRNSRRRRDPAAKGGGDCAERHARNDTAACDGAGGMAAAAACGRARLRRDRKREGAEK